MFKLQAKLFAPQLDLNSYKAELEKLAREVISLAIFEYVVTSTSIIPVWSGASHGTFVELAALAGVPLSINPVPRLPLSARQGVQLGQASSNATLVIDSSVGQYSFSYETTLPHLVYNESENANVNPDPGLFSRLINPGPYNFQKASGDRVVKVLRSFQPPRLTKHITARRVT